MEDSGPINALEALESAQKKYPSIVVEREDNLIYDIGNLTAFDPKSVDTKALSKNTEQYLQDLARDNVQLLFNKIFELPTKKVEDGVVALLPKPTTPLPREKPVPVPKPMTRWEKFAKEKGIVKGKRDRKEFDENSSEYKPRFGRGKAAKIEEDWVIESKGNSATTEDPFEKRDEKKNLKLTKQKKQETRNKLRATKTTGPKLPATIAITADYKAPVQQQKSIMENALSMVQKSTISMGRFDNKLANEKPTKIKQKFESLMTSASSEKTKNLKVIDRMFKKGKVDTTTAARKTIQEHQKKRSQGPPPKKLKRK